MSSHTDERMPRRHAKLGRAELEILRIVTDRAPVTVGEVAEHVAETTGQARTTVLTVMERLRSKGYLSRRKVRGKYHYSPRIDKTELLRGLVQDFVEGALGGSVSPFLAYLSENARLSDAEIANLKRLVRELEDRPTGDER